MNIKSFIFSREDPLIKMLGELFESKDDEIEQAKNLLEKHGYKVVK